MTAPEMEKPPAGWTAEGQPSLVEANGNRAFAHRGGNGKPEGARTLRECGGEPMPRRVAFRASTGRIWRYAGKRGRVLAMLATMRGGLTQWDTLPWHTRLGGTIHALRRDGLAITTEIQGRYRHARYRLATPGCLLIQAEIREAAE